MVGGSGQRLGAHVLASDRTTVTPQEDTLYTPWKENYAQGKSPVSPLTRVGPLDHDLITVTAPPQPPQAD